MWKCSSRDAERMLDVRKRVNVLPLGSAALAGTTYPLDRERVARTLGMEGVCQNSLDACPTATSPSSSPPPPRCAWCT
jgi:argininosuccinate lyase